MFTRGPIRNLNEHELTAEHKKLLININAERAFRSRDSWKIDSTACKPGYHMLMYGGEGFITGPVVQKGMTTDELLIFLRGAYHNN